MGTRGKVGDDSRRLLQVSGPFSSSLVALPHAFAFQDGMVQALPRPQRPSRRPHVLDRSSSWCVELASLRPPGLMTARYLQISPSEKSLLTSSSTTSPVSGGMRRSASPRKLDPSPISRRRTCCSRFLRSGMQQDAKSCARPRSRRVWCRALGRATRTGGIG